jgi:transcriptional regulator with XRE-family HTH domain
MSVSINANGALTSTYVSGYRLGSMQKKKGRPSKTPDKPRPDWALRLINAREAAGKTQSQLGAETDIPQTTIGGYEAGGAEPDLAVIQKLAHALGADPGWIAFGSPNKDDAPLGAIIDRYKEDEAFKMTFLKTAAMLGDEGLNTDLHFTVRLTLRLLEQIKSGADVLSQRERIDAAVTAERLALRAEVAALQKNRF